MKIIVDSRIFNKSEFKDEEELEAVVQSHRAREVKADKGKMNRAQKDQYSTLAKNGYPLRLFHVSIVSVDGNDFEVKEKLLTTAEEIEKGVKNLSQ